MIDLNTKKPVTFKEFKKYYLNLNNLNELNNLYNEYLVNFSKNKILVNNTNNNYIAENYKEFIKNINFNFLQTETTIFLSRLNYNDVYDLDIIVSYVTNYILSELEIYKAAREELKYAKIKNNLITSRAGITLRLKNLILRTLVRYSGYLAKSGVPINLKEISNKLSIKFYNYACNLVRSTENYSDPDVLERTNFQNKIKQLSKDIVQPIKVKHKGKTVYLKANFNRKISANVLYTDYNSLPDRFFANEEKKLENLVPSLITKLYEKYLETDVYQLSGDGNSYNFTKVLSAVNNNSYYNKYNPAVNSDYGTLIDKTKLPQQLCFTNAGLATSLSKNLTYKIDVPAVKGTYLIPDPTKVQPGFGKSKRKSQGPVIFSANNSWIKNNETGNSISVVDNTSLKGFGYQSKEQSLNYSHTGINRQTDEISFWSGERHDIWKNNDTYKKINLTTYPEAERFSDLLITNKTAVTIKTDLYGNEFALYKSVQPDRLGSSSYTTYNSIYDNLPPEVVEDGDCIIYDGQYFEDTLTAISNANPTLYPDIDSIFDVVLFNDVSGCNGLDGWFAPLSTTECAYVTGEDVVDNGYLSAGPLHGLNIALNYFNKGSITFSNTSVPSNYQTSYTSVTPFVSSLPLYNQKYTVPGELYVRDIGTQKVYSFYEKLSSVFTKLPTAAQSAISANEVINFDVVGNTFYIQTSANTFTESYEYDGENFILSVASNSII